MNWILKEIYLNNLLKKNYSFEVESFQTFLNYIIPMLKLVYWFIDVFNFSVYLLMNFLTKCFGLIPAHPDSFRDLWWPGSSWSWTGCCRWSPNRSRRPRGWGGGPQLGDSRAAPTGSLPPPDCQSSLEIRVWPMPGNRWIIELIVVILSKVPSTWISK